MNSRTYYFYNADRKQIGSVVLHNVEGIGDPLKTAEETFGKEYAHYDYEDNE